MANITEVAAPKSQINKAERKLGPSAYCHQRARPSPTRYVPASFPLTVTRASVRPYLSCPIR